MLLRGEHRLDVAELAQAAGDVATGGEVEAVHLDVDGKLAAARADDIAVPAGRRQAALGEELQHPRHDARLGGGEDGEAVDRRGARRRNGTSVGKDIHRAGGRVSDHVRALLSRSSQKRITEAKTE